MEEDELAAKVRGFHMRETSDIYVMVLFWERQVKEMLGFCFERYNCNVSEARHDFTYI